MRNQSNKLRHRLKSKGRKKPSDFSDGFKKINFNLALTTQTKKAEPKKSCHA